jgi:hypothetical protein
MSIARRFLVVAAAGAAVLGFKTYDKVSSNEAMRQKLVSLCEQDKECEGAIEDHFDTCFDETYDISGRRASGHVRMRDFLACFNAKVGTTVFAVNGESGQEEQQASTAH